MLGAVIGDIVGSTREWHNVKSEDFELLPVGSSFTDDSVMTLAVAQWLMTDPNHRPESLVRCMQSLGRKYPHAGYGGMFDRWIHSDNPQPYNSFGNGSAMRVSPVGLYARTLDEALELARISASVTHNHPEGIRGAQAIAAAVFLHKTCDVGAAETIRHYIETHFGYDLRADLDQIRPGYTFDVTCQGSVPIAIMAYLQRAGYPAERALRLAISMGGDSDTIGSMTCAIACARPFYVWGGGISSEVVERCRSLLPADLLEINDRFEEFISRPLHQSYPVSTRQGILFAGEYPGNKDDDVARQKIDRMVHFGIRHFVDLTEEGELHPYSHLLPEGCTYTRFPIADINAPRSVESVHQLINRIDRLMSQTARDEYVYIHCWGGVGRTGTIVACILARDIEDPTPDSVLQALRSSFCGMPKSSHRKTPESKAQLDFISEFTAGIKAHRRAMAERVHDCIRGCLIAGAAGDALGYAVEFDKRESIISQYGSNGITQFRLDSNGKAQISDDTQMTLFTANGMLTGITRGQTRGIGGLPENYVDGAYIDWYYTQTGLKDTDDPYDFHYTWLRDIPQLHHRRAPGNTCLDACHSLLHRQPVKNNSKGCGGIMRVAPMACLIAAYTARRQKFYNNTRMCLAAAQIAAVTHKHPLGFLPAAMLTQLIYALIPLSADEGCDQIVHLARDTICGLYKIYPDEYLAEKRTLADLTRKAITLAQSDMPPFKAIPLLGEGWTGDEAWAIALYCAVRYPNDPAKAIIVAVNHDGDSDSTGSICGNILGAIHGYRHLTTHRLFCPDGPKATSTHAARTPEATHSTSGSTQEALHSTSGRTLEETLELHDIILEIADDLSTPCPLTEYTPLDTPARRRWHTLYCLMQPLPPDPAE